MGRHVNQRYRVTVDSLTLGDAQVVLARIFHATGKQAEMELMDDEPIAPRGTVPFCLVRNIETTEVGTFAGYVGAARFNVVLSDEETKRSEACSDWEPIDGHGGTVDWPLEG